MAQTHSSDDPEVADAQFEEADIVDAQGNVVTGGLTGDMKIRWVGLAAFIVLFCSWTTQWVAFALPYWKADKYHNAGLFTVCSHVEWEFVNVTRIYCPEKNDPNFATYQCFDPSIPGAFIETTQELQPGSPIEKCQSINDYVDDFKKLVCVPPYESQHYCFYAENSKRYIIRSRWFEAISTCLDMTFGITTLIFMIWPDKEPKKNVRNGIIALIGIFLTPWPTVIDLLLQTEYWNDLGIGIFEKDNKQFLAYASQIGIATTTIDLVVQFGYLSWAVRCHGWKIKGFDWNAVKMGPTLYFGGSRKARLDEERKRNDEENERRVERVVDAIMEMGVPASISREQVQLITIAHNADINAVLEVVMASGEEAPATTD